MKLEAKEVMNAIAWFQSSGSFDLAQLMEKSRFLACQSYAFADAVGTANREFVSLRVRRKKLFSELRNNFTQAGAKSIADAERQAEVNPDYQKLYEQEKEAEARWEHGKNLLWSLKSINDAMRQEIAELRQEKKHYVEEDMMERIVKKVNEQNRRFESQIPLSQ